VAHGAETGHPVAELAEAALECRVSRGGQCGHPNPRRPSPRTSAGSACPAQAPQRHLRRVRQPGNARGAGRLPPMPVSIASTFAVPPAECRAWLRSPGHALNHFVDGAIAAEHHHEIRAAGHGARGQRTGAPGPVVARSPLRGEPARAFGRGPTSMGFLRIRPAYGLWIRQA
jgi:hypothetical protein